MTLRRNLLLEIWVNSSKRVIGVFQFSQIARNSNGQIKFDWLIPFKEKFCPKWFCLLIQHEWNCFKTLIVFDRYCLISKIFSQVSWSVLSILKFLLYFSSFRWQKVGKGSILKSTKYQTVKIWNSCRECTDEEELPFPGNEVAQKSFQNEFSSNEVDLLKIPSASKIVFFIKINNDRSKLVLCTNKNFHIVGLNCNPSSAWSVQTNAQNEICENEKSVKKCSPANDRLDSLWENKLSDENCKNYFVTF